MANFAKRTFSLFLALVMLMSVSPGLAAAMDEVPAGNGASEIAFSASAYTIAENEKALKVKIVRSGATKKAVDVAFKAADFTAYYDEDYRVLDEDGVPLPKVEGIAPDESDIMPLEEQFPGLSEYAPVSSAADELEEAASEPAETATVAPAVEEPEEPAEEATDAAEPVEAAEEAADAEPVETGATEAPAEEVAEDAGEAEAVDEAQPAGEATEAAEPVEEAADAEPVETEATEAPAEEVAEDAGEAEAVDEAQEATEAAEEPADVTEEPAEETREEVVEADTPNAVALAVGGFWAGVKALFAGGDDETDADADAELLDADAVTLPPLRRSTGSSLLDAQAAYLQLPDENAQIEEDVAGLLGELNDYFSTAQGTAAVVHFAKGVKEREITFEILDNDAPEADKIILLALMGVNGDENTGLAAKTTAYVNIVDDEPYETPVISPATQSITLTQDKPTAELTLNRSRGLNYYTSVALSTVTETAQPAYHYDVMDELKVSFAPGETSKTVTISGRGFDDDVTWGIRLWDDGTCDIRNEYVRVTMEKAPEQAALQSADGDTAELLAATMGSSQSTMILDNLSLRGGPSTNGPKGSHGTDWNGSSRWTDYWLRDYSKNGGRTWVSNNTIDTAGVNNLVFWHTVDADKCHDFIELITDYGRSNYNGGEVKALSKGGSFGWRQDTMNVSDLKDKYYLRFGLRMDGYLWWSYHYARLGNPITINWQQYTISSVVNSQVFNRYEYDYADKSGQASKIPFTDGRSDYDYRPSIKMVNGSGTEISSFYANANQILKPVSTNPSLDAKYGIKLEGVYLYTKDSSDLYRNGNWYSTSKTYWIPASGVTVNQDFARNLANVLGASTTSFRVMPKFTQQTVTLNIHNVDGGGTYIANLNTTNKKDASWRDWGKNGYYNQYTFPLNSKIKVRAVPAKGKTITGFNIDLWSKAAKDDPVYANSDALERMTYTLTEGMSFYPRTENDGMNVAYMPNTNKIVSSLQGRVFTQPNTLNAGDTILYSNNNGDIQITSAYAGMPWTLRATAPDGYYVKWTNGTGDIKTVNGKIDVSSNPNLNEETSQTRKFQSSYVPVYGDILAGTILQSNTKYYYEFVKNSGSSNNRVLGKVYRESGTFREILSGQRLTKEAAANTQVSVAGTYGFTDGNGDFNINLNNVPTSGYVSVLVNNDGVMYPTTALANYMSITLPAYECFKPNSLTVRYDDSSKYPVNAKDALVNISDNRLNVIAGVQSNGTLQPVGVKFYIHKSNGQVIDCSSDSQKRFSVSFADGIGTLSFNPKSVMDSGDTVWVAFIDQNQKEYPALDIGYEFIAPLNLKSFLFPMIGSSLVSNAYNAATELIGDPLGDVSMGSLGFNEPVSEKFTPPGMPDSYAYTVSTYQFGDYSKAIKTFEGGSKDDKDKDKDKNKDSGNTTKDSGNTTKDSGNTTKDSGNTKKEKTEKEVAEDSKKAAKENGKEAKDGGYKTKASYSWKLSPKVVFAMQISSRPVTENGQKKWKYYFEELDFIAGLDFEVGGKINITLPIGATIIISAGLNGNVTGIYQMRTNYEGDSTHTANKVEYSAETFGLFKSMEHVDRVMYLMLDPSISLGLGVKVAIIEVGGNANFKFDMDFEFGITHSYVAYYGDMTYNFDWYIKVLSIKVYSSKTKDRTVKLFNSQGVNGHITPSSLVASLMSADGNAPLQSVPSPRGYANDMTQWNGDAQAALLDIDATTGTSEQSLLEGIYPSANVKLTVIGDNRILMTFIADVPSRTAINRTALFYSIFNGSQWSAPARVDPSDDTLDDYPEAIDLGDKVLVAWSSANKVLPDTAGAADALSALDLKVTFFDKASNTFGPVTQVTHDTTEDYTADVMPHAAYDPETNRVLLYYTKTEYLNAQNMNDLAGAPSVIGYLFYDMASGTWDSAYTDEELTNVVNDLYENPSQMTAEQIAKAKSDYAEHWYGQRFLDIRTNTSGEMNRIVDSDAISYNGLALYSWVVDYDRDLNTTTDRDVFLQIYNFSERSFTHIIRMTSNVGAYSTPHFGRYNDTTYLFYSAVGELDGSGDAEQSGIAYFDVTDVVKNDKLTKVTENGANYYKLEYEEEVAASTDSAGATVPAHTETVTIQPSYAVSIEGFVNNYSVDVDANEKIYLTWTDGDDNGARQVYTSIFDVDPNDETGAAAWSEAFALTATENVAYGNLDGAVLNGNLYICASKTPYIVSEEGNSLDENNASLVALTHTPFSAPATVEEEKALTHDTEYVYPGEAFILTSTLKNNGTKMVNDPVTFKFSMTDGGKTTELGTVTKEGTWGAGKELSAEWPVDPLTEINEGLKFDVSATVAGTEITQTLTPARQADVRLESDPTFKELLDGHLMTLSFKNHGNLDSEAGKVEVYLADNDERGEKIGEFTLDPIPANSDYDMEANVAIPDSAYTIDGDDGVASLKVVVTVDSEEIDDKDASAHRQFDGEAIATMRKVTGFTVSASGDIQASEMNDVQIPTSISGTAGEDVMVIWESSNSDVVYVREDATLFAAGEGTAEMTGYVVPSKQNIAFNENGEASTDNYLKSVPENLHRTVTATVKVSAASGQTPAGSDSYVVTVNGGSGAGQYAQGASVTITANAPESGKQFKEWTGADGLTFTSGDKNSATATFTMPANAVSVTATYEDIPATGHDVVVNNGQGSGKHAVGDSVTITANNAPDGQVFAGWTGADGLTFTSGDKNSATATFTMPDRNVNVTATFKAQTQTQTKSGGCYVATSVYGSYDCPEVWTLRRFRDNVLAETWYGRLFIRLYYAVSPTAVKLFGDHEWFQNFFRGRLDQMVSGLQADGFESTPYDDPQW